MIEHLSYSSISKYLLCGKSFEFRYLKNESEPRSPGLVFGSVIHKTIYSYLKDGIHLIDAWGVHWKEEAEDGPINWGNDNPNDLFEYGTKMLSTKEVKRHIKDLVPGFILGESALEHYVELQVPAVPVPVIGYIDMIDNQMIPYDFKTSSRSWNQQRADSELQATFYIAALNQIGLVSLPCKFKYLVFVKNKTPKVQLIETERTVQDIWRMMELVREMWGAIQKDVFMPAPGSWVCSEKYCGFWNQCRFGGGS